MSSGSPHAAPTSGSGQGLLRIMKSFTSYVPSTARLKKGFRELTLPIPTMTDVHHCAELFRKHVQQLEFRGMGKYSSIFPTMKTHLGRTRPCCTQQLAGQDVVKSSFLPLMGPKHAHADGRYSATVPLGSDPREFALQSRLVDPTLEIETIEVGVNFHVMCEIIDPSTGTCIPKENRKRIEEYFEFLIARLNSDYNCTSEEFDNADFDKDKLFSDRHNGDSRRAELHRTIYAQFLPFARRANVIFVIPNMSDCSYDPAWDEFHADTLTQVYQMHLRNTTLEDFRDWADPVIKGYTQDARTKRYDKPTGFGHPSKNPGKVMDYWIVQFPDHEPGQPGVLEGYGTFPDDPRAGSRVDGVVVSGGVAQWDADLMDPLLNRWKTFSHEGGHCLGLTHTFDETDQVDDMPRDDQVDNGDTFALTKWPCTQGQPHAIMNPMGYQSDSRMGFFTHDQVIRVRNILRTSRKSWVVRTYPTPLNSSLRQPITFRHALEFSPSPTGECDGDGEEASDEDGDGGPSAARRQQVHWSSSPSSATFTLRNTGAAIPAQWVGHQHHPHSHLHPTRSPTPVAPPPPQNHHQSPTATTLPLPLPLPPRLTMGVKVETPALIQSAYQPPLVQVHHPHPVQQRHAQDGKMMSWIRRMFSKDATTTTSPTTFSRGESINDGDASFFACGRRTR